MDSYFDRHIDRIDVDTLINTINQAKEEISKVIIGQEDVINLCLITIFTGHHALIEGVPGVAKTLLVRTLAKIMGCDFNRIQFTPDLMPADITGTNIYNMKTSEFNLIKGPVFTSFLLADEINRAPAKTQSALLQAMQERQVTIDRETHDLNESFTVFATQNPIEFEGTYPLPEAQKDRFMLKIIMKEPNHEEELLLAQRLLGDDSPENVLKADQLESVVTPDTLVKFREALKGITVQQELIQYMVNIVRATRSYDSILVGAGPRATESLLHASRANAAINGRDFVTPDDIKEMAPSVLQHRIIIRPEYEIEGLMVNDVINQIVKDIAVPR